MAEAPCSVPVAMATSRKPACAMEEYASNRLRLRCTRPIALPTTMVAMARPTTARCQLTNSPPKASSHTRRKTANAAAFTVAAMYAVTGFGEPSYTSGAHMWNGTVATLNPKPTSSNAMPIRLPRMAKATCAGVRVTATWVTISTFGPGVGTTASQSSVKAERTEKSRESGIPVIG